MIHAPKLPSKVLHTMKPEDVITLIGKANSLRDSCIIALMHDSGARRSEISVIQVSDVNLESKRIRVDGKGRKEGHLVIGADSGVLLKAYLDSPAGRSQIDDDSLFGMKGKAIQNMLLRLGERTGIKCNAHSFRRGFATEQLKAGVSVMDIKQLGRWSSVSLVERYTKAYTFEDAASRYKDTLIGTGS